MSTDRVDEPYEYVVVGSGAGGGTVAARLAERGHRVLLLEAGGDPLTLRGGNALRDGNCLPDDYRVPIFHAIATENRAMAWDFFVRHYADDQRQRSVRKHVATRHGRRVDGVLYPRAGCLGGCTAHNAMITLYPHNEDWDFVARLTGDRSWSAANMRRYFQRLERCRHRPFHRWLAKLGINPTRHGFDGWLQTEAALPMSALGDEDVVACMRTAIREVFGRARGRLDRMRWQLLARADPNDWRLVRDDAEGIRFFPLATRDHERIGTRDRVAEVAAAHPDRLTVELDALATRVLLDDANRAIGVAYRKGERLYRAHHAPGAGPGEARIARVSREVILAGGSFNTPQLLMLSGIGPQHELERHGIDARVDLPGVGTNLQDRYEVGVVHRMDFDRWQALDGARFAADDPLYRRWAAERKGVYTTNGAVLAVLQRSFRERPLPDLACFAILGRFDGYYPNYTKDLPARGNYLTWAVLKAHTQNTAGTVRLRSSDPCDTPDICFRYFEDGNDAEGEDLRSVIEGVKLVRTLTGPLRKKGLIVEEEVPGEDVQDDEAIAEFVRRNAWGHHASGSCPIGDRSRGGVVNGDFEVHGTRGLRIVDASVFPRIPGFFIVSSVYMIGEKAADVIADAASG